MKDLWIPAGAASKILSERFGRPVRVDYVTKLGKLNRLRTQHIGSRIVLYNRHDVETVNINFRKPKETTPKPVEENRPIEEAA
jgi:hypothetical protein